MSQATVDVQEEGGGRVQIVLDGEIDLANVTDVENQIHAALHNQVTVVIVDLTDVDYIDSAGVRLLVKLASRLRILRIDFRINVPADSVARRVVELTGLEAFAVPPPS